MYSVYEVKKNESLNDISNRLNISLEELISLNNNVNTIKEGQLIIIPNGNQYNTYVVKKGDNLYSIARRYNIDEKTLELLNGLKENEYIYPGQKLLIQKDNVYVTKENDTVKKLLDSGITLDNLYNIYLQNDQIIFYKKD